MTSSYYVDNSVSSNGNGTQNSPWKNLSNINWSTISMASKPCTIYVSGGTISQTYNEQLNVGASGTSSTYPYNGVPTGEIIIKRPSENEWAGHSGNVFIRYSGIVIDVTSRSNIIIDGFDVRATGNTESQAPFWSSYGTPSRYITVRNCTSSQNQGYCFALQDANHITIQNNKLGPNDTTYGQDIIGAWGSDTVVENNVIIAALGPSGEAGPHSDGIHFGGPSNNWTIRYNLFQCQEVAYMIYLETLAGGPLTNIKIYGNLFEMSMSTIGASNRGIEFDCNLGGSLNYSTAWIYNNTFVNFNNIASGGFHAGVSYIANCTSTSQQIHLKNNIFYNSLVYLDGNKNGLSMNNNLYYTDGVQDDIIISWSGTDYTSLNTFKSNHPGYETNGIQADPYLKSVTNISDGNHDLRPTTNSPGINMGEVLGSPYDFGLSLETTKYNFPFSVKIISRPQGTGYDIGAYEYSETTTCPTPLASFTLKIL